MTPEQYSKLLTDNEIDGKPWSEVPTDVLKKILNYYENNLQLYGVRIPAIQDELRKRKNG